MNDFGISELLLVGLLLLLFVGPERLPTVVRTLGRLYGRLRRAADDLRRALVLEADRIDEQERLKELRKRRLEAERERQRMAAETGSRAQPDAAGPSEGDEPPADTERVPDGLTEEEWRELPPHIREIVARRRGAS